MMDVSLLSQRLTEAENARHKLLTGSMRERISRGGTEITYTRADIPALERYIEQLRSDLAAVLGTPRRTIMNLSF